MNTLPKVILLLSFLSTFTILIVGAILGISGLIIGGIIGIFGSAILGTAVMIHYSSIQDNKTENNICENRRIEIVNPLSV